MSDRPSTLKARLLKETALFTGLLFFGLVVMPLVTYLLGQEVFGTYAGSGYGDFFGTLSGKVRQFDWVAWFLVLAPYLIWQCLRLTAFAWRMAGRLQ